MDIFYRGMRVRLKRDVTDLQGVSHTAGETGTATSLLDGGVVVDLDGYERERAEAEARRISTGEASNVVRYHGWFRADDLELA